MKEIKFQEVMNGRKREVIAKDVRGYRFFNTKNSYEWIRGKSRFCYNKSTQTFYNSTTNNVTYAHFNKFLTIQVIECIR